MRLIVVAFHLVSVFLMYCSSSNIQLEVEPTTVYTIILKATSETNSKVYFVKTTLSDTDSNYKTSFIQNIDFFTFETDFSSKQCNGTESYALIIEKLKDTKKTKLIQRASYDNLQFIDLHDTKSLLKTSFNNFLLEELKPTFSIGALDDEDNVTVGNKYISLFFNDDLSSYELSFANANKDNTDVFFLGNKMFKKINLHFNVKETKTKDKYKLMFKKIVPDNYFKERFYYFDYWKDISEQYNEMTEFINGLIELKEEVTSTYNVPNNEGLIVLNDFVHSLLVDGHFVQRGCDFYLTEKGKECEFENIKEFGLNEYKWIVSIEKTNDKENELEEKTEPSRKDENFKALVEVICVAVFGGVLIVTVIVELTVRNRRKKRYKRNFVNNGK